MTITLLPAFNQTSRLQVCSICGLGPGTVDGHPESVDRPVIGTGVSIDFEGDVDICLNCAREIGSVAGMLSEDEAHALREAAAVSAATEGNLRDELAAVRGALAGMREEAQFHERREADALAEGYQAGLQAQAQAPETAA